jgi:Gram-negative porin
MRKIYLYSGSALLSLLLIFSAFTPALALEVKLSGQVDQMVMFADDGENNDFFVTDNSNSSTRFRFQGSEVFGKVKAGVYLEWEALRNPSSKVTIHQTSDNPAGTSDFNLRDRWLNAFFDTPWGTLEIGKGNSAAYTTAQVDLSGTAVAGYSDLTNTGGSIDWKSDATGASYAAAAGGPIHIGSTTSNFDGPLSRSERLRYNSPTFAGFTWSGAVENGGDWDTSLFYSAELYGKLAAAVGYTQLQRYNGATFDHVLDGSISWLAPFGLNVTVEAGKGFRVDGATDPTGAGADDPFNYWAKLGYKFGIHAFSIEYGQTKDLAANGDKSSTYGAEYVINPWKPVELFAAYRLYKLDRDAAVGGNAENINVAYAGTRIKF